MATLDFHWTLSCIVSLGSTILSLQPRLGYVLASGTTNLGFHAHGYKWHTRK